MIQYHSSYLNLKGIFLDIIYIIDIILIISILTIIYFVVNTFFNRTPIETKSVEVKKEEIIIGYEMQMKELLAQKFDNHDELTLEKTKLLKQISKELSTNIFFDKSEVKFIIQKLVNI